MIWLTEKLIHLSCLNPFLVAPIGCKTRGKLSDPVSCCLIYMQICKRCILHICKQFICTELLLAKKTLSLSCSPLFYLERKRGKCIWEYVPKGCLKISCRSVGILWTPFVKLLKQKYDVMHLINDLTNVPQIALLNTFLLFWFFIMLLNTYQDFYVKKIISKTNCTSTLAWLTFAQYFVRCVVPLSAGFQTRSETALTR